MKKYDAYKDSGVKWIGEIPNHWEVVPLKRTGSFENGLTYSPNDIRDKGYIVSVSYTHLTLPTNSLV